MKTEKTKMFLLKLLHYTGIHHFGSEPSQYFDLDLANVPCDFCPATKLIEAHRPRAPARA